jgi:inner membrane protein
VEGDRGYGERMASAITHFIVGAALGLPARFDGVLPRWTVPVTCGLLAAAPDLDTPLMFALELPRGSLFAHRGFFHSPLFLAMLCGLLAAAATRGRSWVALAALWTACAVTHPLLDMLTDGGSGVMLFFPFSEARLFFPWRPIRVSPLGIAGFFDRAADILSSEAPFDAAAVGIGLAAATMKSASRRARGLS